MRIAHKDAPGQSGQQPTNQNGDVKMMTIKQAYDLGFDHGSEMARLINADPSFAENELGWGSEDESLMAAYTDGCQAGADATVAAQEV